MIRSRRIRGAILDVDGTLLDSNDAHARAWVRALALGGHEVPFERVRRLIGMGGDKLIPALTGLDPHDAAGRLIADRRRQIFRQDYLPLLGPHPGARNLLVLLQARGIRRVVASSADDSELLSELQAARVEDLVEHVVSKDQAGGHSKPDPDPIRSALDCLGMETTEVVMIGDTPYDIEAAARAGVPTIALRCGGWSSQDLADAVAVYDDPQDLVNEIGSSPFAGREAA